MPGVDVPPFHVMDVMAAAEAEERRGRPILHLEVGQPSTPAPAGVRAAAVAAIATERLGYTSANGLPQLRDRIARHYGETADLDLDPRRIIPTVGASGGFGLAFLSAFAAGDAVAVTEPGYPCYRNTLLAFGRRPVPVAVDATSRFQPTPALLDDAASAAGGLAGAVVASPSNPTGTALRPDELDALVAWSEQRRVQLVLDEIYHGITYVPIAPTALSRSDDVIVLNSFSKYFSMTGWRLGWMVVPGALVGPVDRLAANLVICPPTLSQHAAVAAFDCAAELDTHVTRYRTNRAVLLEGLARAGFSELSPVDGAFYVYADVTHLTDDSASLCTRWLTELGVAVTPGIDFDSRRGRRTVRFSFAGATEDIAEAVNRLGG